MSDVLCGPLGQAGIRLRFELGGKFRQCHGPLRAKCWVQSHASGGYAFFRQTSRRVLTRIDRLRDWSSAGRDESERSATKKEIAQLKMINTGLLESQTVLNDKYKALLTEKDKHVPFSQYLRKVDQLEAEISRLREAALRSGKRARPSKKPCA